MGRPRGVPNKATKYREQIQTAQGILPLDYMLKVLRDPNEDKARRDEMAKAAAPYVHPRLASTTTKLSGEIDIRKWLSELED
jgi:hypothetical protein